MNISGPQIGQNIERLIGAPPPQRQGPTRITGPTASQNLQRIIGETPVRIIPPVPTGGHPGGFGAPRTYTNLLPWGNLDALQVETAPAQTVNLPGGRPVQLGGELAEQVGRPAAGERYGVPGMTYVPGWGQEIADVSNLWKWPKQLFGAHQFSEGGQRDVEIGARIIDTLFQSGRMVLPLAVSRGLQAAAQEAPKNGGARGFLRTAWQAATAPQQQVWQNIGEISDILRPAYAQYWRKLVEEGPVETTRDANVWTALDFESIRQHWNEGRDYSYTWTFDPEARDAYLRDKQAAQQQLGRPLTDREIDRLKQQHENPNTEMVGEMIFDLTNLVPGFVWDKVFEGIKIPFKGAWKIAKVTPGTREAIEWATKATLETAGRWQFNKAFRAFTRLWESFPGESLDNLIVQNPLEQMAKGRRPAAMAASDYRALSELNEVIPQFARDESGTLRNRWADIAEEAYESATERAEAVGRAWETLDDVARKQAVISEMAHRFQSEYIVQSGQPVRYADGTWKKWVDGQLVTLKPEVANAVEVGRIANYARSVWIEANLSARPGFTVINTLDSAVRLLLSGAGFMEDLGAILRGGAYLPPEVISGFAGASDEALAEFIKTKGRIPYPWETYWQAAKTGTRESSAIAGLPAPLGRAYADKVPFAKYLNLANWTEGWRDFNQAVEFSLRVRSYHNYYWRLFGGYNTEFGDRLIAQLVSDPRNQATARRIWAAALDDPLRFRSLMDDFLTGKVAWEHVVPPGISGLMQGRDIPSGQAANIIRGVTEDLLKAVNAKGRLTPEAMAEIFARWRTEIRQYAAQAAREGAATSLALIPINPQPEAEAVAAMAAGAVDRADAIAGRAAVEAADELVRGANGAISREAAAEIAANMTPQQAAVAGDFLTPEEAQAIREMHETGIREASQAPEEYLTAGAQAARAWGAGADLAAQRGGEFQRRFASLQQSSGELARITNRALREVWPAPLLENKLKRRASKWAATFQLGEGVYLQHYQNGLAASEAARAGLDLPANQSPVDFLEAAGITLSDWKGNVPQKIEIALPGRDTKKLLTASEAERFMAYFIDDLNPDPRLPRQGVWDRPLPLDGPAIWHAQEHDLPVVVTGYAGSDVQGRGYVYIEGSRTALPLDEIEMVPAGAASKGQAGPSLAALSDEEIARELGETITASMRTKDPERIAELASRAEALDAERLRRHPIVTPRPPEAAPPVMTRALLGDTLRREFQVTEEEAQAALALVDARARTAGVTPDEWIGSHIAVEGTGRRLGQPPMQGGITSIKGRQPGPLDALVDEGMALWREGRWAGAEAKLREALRPGMEHLELILPDYPKEIRFSYGQFADEPEPTIYVLADVPEEGAPEFLYALGKEGDESFRQWMVIGSRDAPGVILDVAGQQGSVVHPLVRIEFEQALAPEDLTQVWAEAQKLGIGGYTVRPDRRAIELLPGLEYTGGRDTKAFLETIADFQRNLAGLHVGGGRGIPTIRPRETWYFYAGEGGQAPGVYTYEQAYKFLEDLDPAGTARVQQRLADNPYPYAPPAGDVPPTLEQLHRGAVDFLADGRAVLRGLEAPDISTVAHELGHIFRRDLQPADLAVAERWAGLSRGEWASLDQAVQRGTAAEAAQTRWRDAEEKFARGFEQYLADGEAPTEELKPIFERFKTWLAEIYQAVRDYFRGDRLTPDMRGVFDRLLAESELIANRDALFRAAAEEGIATATTAGRRTNGHLLNALNKAEYRGGFAAFTREELERGLTDRRAAEALAILEQRAHLKLEAIDPFAGYVREMMTRPEVQRTLPATAADMARELFFDPDNMTPENWLTVHGKALVEAEDAYRLTDANYRQMLVDARAAEELGIQSSSVTGRRASKRAREAVKEQRRVLMDNLSWREFNKLKTAESERWAQIADEAAYHYFAGRWGGMTDWPPEFWEEAGRFRSAFEKFEAEFDIWGNELRSEIESGAPASTAAGEMVAGVQPSGLSTTTKLPASPASTPLESRTTGQGFMSLSVAPEARPGQAQMFTQGEDLPLFSGTAQRGREEVFRPVERAGEQGRLPGIETAPEMRGARPGDTPLQGEIAELEARQIRLREQIRDLRPRAQAEYPAFGPLNQQLQDLERSAKATGMQLSAARKRLEQGGLRDRPQPGTRAYLDWWQTLSEAEQQAELARRQDRGRLFQDALGAGAETVGEARARQAWRNSRSVEDMLDYWEQYLTRWADEMAAQEAAGARTLTPAEKAMWEKFRDEGTAGLADVRQRAVEEATRQTNRDMINYTDEFNLDRVMKWFFPFWKFPSRSLPYWLEMFATHPQLVTAILKQREMSDRYAYQRGAVTRSGEPLPRMGGYIPLGESDWWINPFSPFSFRQALPEVDRANLYDDGIDPNDTGLKQLAAWLLPRQQLLGLYLAPWVEYPLRWTGLVEENQFPKRSLIGFLDLVPPWTQRNVMNWARKTFWPTAPEMWTPEVSWKDYLIEREILGEAMAVIRSAGNHADQWNAADRAWQAVHDHKGPVWEAARAAVERDDYWPRALGFFSGIYPKKFSTGEAELIRARNEIAGLREQIRDKTGYDVWRDTRYETPAGKVSGLYGMINVRSEQGKQVYGAERRTLLTGAMEDDRAVNEFIHASGALYERRDAELRALPLGAPYAARAPIYEKYQAQINALEDKLPGGLGWTARGKPDDMVRDHLTDTWMRMLNSTRPQFRADSETWLDYQARVAQWESELPEIASTVWTTFVNRARREGADQFVAASGHLFPNMAQAATLNHWDLANDDAYDALNRVWRDNYWNGYWALVNGLGGYEREIAERAFKGMYPNGPSETELIAWVNTLYPGRFSNRELAEVINGGEGVWSVGQRLGYGATPEDRMADQVWDVISMAGPNKAALREALGDQERWLDFWYMADGTPAAFGDLEEFYRFHDAVMQAQQNLGLTEPDAATLREYAQAEGLHNRYRAFRDQTFPGVLDAQNEYYNQSSRNRRGYLREHPELKAYWDWRDAWTTDFPVWTKYFRPDAYDPDTDEVTLKGGSSAGGGGNYATRGFARGGSRYVRKPPHYLSRPPSGGSSSYSASKSRLRDYLRETGQPFPGRTRGGGGGGGGFTTGGTGQAVYLPMPLRARSLEAGDLGRGGVTRGRPTDWNVSVSQVLMQRIAAGQIGDAEWAYLRALYVRPNLGGQEGETFVAWVKRMIAEGNLPPIPEETLAQVDEAQAA